MPFALPIWVTNLGPSTRAVAYASIMDSFHFVNGQLHAESVPLAQIAERFGTPTFVYSSATIRDHVRKLQVAYAPLKARICFAVKACPNLSVLRLLAQSGCGMDVVSGGELYRALLAGVQPEQIVFAGVGKSTDELRAALGDHSALFPPPSADQPSFTQLPARPIGCINVESEQELGQIAEIARSMQIRANCALRINPDVAAGGHKHISTGGHDSKFGIPIEQAGPIIRRFASDKHIALTGLHVHIGSSITSPAPFVQATQRLLQLITALASPGANGEPAVAIKSLDLGGGFGADYQTGDAPAASVFAEHLIPLLAPFVALGLAITIEPGRMIVANAGVLLTRVRTTKQSGPSKFIVLDSGMNHLIRPALYEAFHFIWPTSVSPQHEPPRRSADLSLPGLERCEVVGPICESGDYFARGRLLPPISPGELLGIFAAGAYAMSMASRYNSHPLPAEVIVDGSDVWLARSRETLADLVSHEHGSGVRI